MRGDFSFQSLYLLFPLYAHGGQGTSTMWVPRPRLRLGSLSPYSFFFSFFKIYLFIFVYTVLPVYMSAGQKREPDLITDVCEPPCGCWELNSGLLEEQSVLLSSEPSLQSPTRSIIKKNDGQHHSRGRTYMSGQRYHLGPGCHPVPGCCGCGPVTARVQIDSHGSGYPQGL